MRFCRIRSSAKFCSTLSFRMSYSTQWCPSVARYAAKPSWRPEGPLNAWMKVLGTILSVSVCLGGAGPGGEGPVAGHDEEEVKEHADVVKLREDGP